MDAQQLKETREQREALIGRCQSIMGQAADEGRDMTEAEKQELDTAQDTIETLDSAITDAENDCRKQRLDAQVARAAKPQSRAVPAQPHTDRLQQSDVRVYPKCRGGKVPKGFDTHEQAYAAGQWIKAQLAGNQAARDWCGWNVETRVLTEGTNADGGFLVPDEFESAVILLRDSFAVARGECTVMGMGSDVRNVPKWGTSPDAAFYPEETAIADGDLTLARVTLTAQKLGRLSIVTNELFDDASIDLAGFLAEDFARAFANKEDECWIQGDGTTTDGNISGIATLFDSNNNFQGVVTAASGNDQFSELELGDFAALVAACPAYALDNAKFYISQFGFARSMEALAWAGGGNTVQTLETGLSRRFMGYPVVVTNQLPTSDVSENDDTMVLFGDMRKNTIFGDRNQIRLQVLTELYAANYMTGIIATERFDIQNHGTPTDSNDLIGPVVGLVGTS